MVYDFERWEKEIIGISKLGGISFECLKKDGWIEGVNYNWNSSDCKNDDVE